MRILFGNARPQFRLIQGIWVHLIVVRTNLWRFGKFSSKFKLSDNFTSAKVFAAHLGNLLNKFNNFDLYSNTPFHFGII